MSESFAIKLASLNWYSTYQTDPFFRNKPEHWNQSHSNIARILSLLCIIIVYKRKPYLKPILFINPNTEELILNTTLILLQTPYTQVKSIIGNKKIGRMKIEKIRVFNQSYSQDRTKIGNSYNPNDFCMNYLHPKTEKPNSFITHKKNLKNRSHNYFLCKRCSHLKLTSSRSFLH